MSTKTIIANAKKTVEANGAPSVATLSQMFNDADLNHHGFLNIEDETESLLKQLGLKLKLRELRTIIKQLDPDDEKKVYLPNFIAFFAKELPENRLSLVKNSFKALSPDGSTKLTIDHLRKRFGDSQYTVIGGRRILTDQLLADLSQLFDMDDDGVITEADFINYYRDFSTKIESDELFESIVKASWAF